MKLFVDKKQKKVHNTLNFKFLAKGNDWDEKQGEVLESRWMV